MADHAAAADRDDLRKRLEKAARGLLFLSETDAPFTFAELFPAPAELTPDAVRAALGAPAETPVSGRTLDDFLSGHIEQADPEDPVARKNVRRFATLKDTLNETLSGATVFRVGDVQVRYYVLGRTSDGRVAGLVTEAVET